MVDSVKTVSGFVSDKRVEAGVKALDTFVESIQILFGAFDSYEGGEFCQGLVFGREGYRLLGGLADVGEKMFSNVGSQFGKGLGKKNPAKKGGKKKGKVDF